ncbi:hypothetical protein [Psychroserpens damuponensis]|uniref:hypothetical protein n=1 Tax=Psychroserpens damuponensis TaxID=943936 RepID=UPI0005915770|nr:hypothetical protein [Psychroserpens damuponensis]
MTNKITLDFCEIHIYEYYMIVTMNTGITVTAHHNNSLKEIANIHFKNRPFVYITHRINSYSVDPAVYKETSKINNLIGICVVSNSYIAKSTAQIEKLFLNNKPFEIFSDLDKAIEWANSVTK